MSFFTKITSGIAYGIGVGIGLTIWAVIKRIIILVCIAGGLSIFASDLFPGADLPYAFLTDLFYTIRSRLVP